MPIFIIVLDIILLLESFTNLLPDLQTKRILKTDHLIDGMVTTYTFYADRFDMENSLSKGEVPYEKLYRIIETPTYFYLYLNKMSAYLVSKEEFSKILSDAWARSENPNSDPNFTQKELVSMFKQADPTILMDQAERKRLAELEDTVTVYRGVTSLNADNIRAMSWTLDKEVAEWFAHRYKEDGTVYEAEINKKYILALFMERNESEVVVDPKYLQNIEELQEQGIQQVQN